MPEMEDGIGVHPTTPLLRPLRTPVQAVPSYNEGRAMWNDVETTQDLLNFKVVADTAAQMILNNCKEIKDIQMELIYAR